MNNLISEAQLSKVYDLYNALNRDDIVDILISGSKVNPYITNPHDVDIVFVFKDFKIARSVLKSDDIIHLRNVGIDIHFESAYTHVCHNSHWDYSILQDKYIESDITPAELFNKSLNSLDNLLYEDNPNLKLWYELYASLCYYLNNAFEIKEDQLDMLQRLHNRKGTQEDIDFIKNKIKEIKNG